MIPDINIEDYNYCLPEERIAKYPLEERDASKLLVYDRKGECSRRIFRELPDILPGNTMMIFNDTKVVPARLFFHRATGAAIEIFCLRPVEPAEYASSFASVGKCRWKCVIGNSKKWKGDILESDVKGLRAALIDRDAQTGTVEFRWDSDAPFSRILELCGQVPIPPYLKRDTEAIDIERYQTMYAHTRGSVAAPTAGLHFTDEVMNRISARGIDIENVCLHVGAGTFLPVKSSKISGHRMHLEPFTVSRKLLEKLRDSDREVTAVGTTSVRTLESLYYIGVSCIETGEPAEVEQWDPYSREYDYSEKEALDAIISYLDRNGLPELKIATRIIIVPGFRFRLVKYMVTNFHQPQSTLLLLVSAFVGGDWKTVYDYALGNGFRFLSYGDSSLLFRHD